MQDDEVVPFFLANSIWGHIQLTHLNATTSIDRSFLKGMWPKYTSGVKYIRDAGAPSKIDRVYNICLIAGALPCHAICCFSSLGGCNGKPGVVTVWSNLVIFLLGTLRTMLHQINTVTSPAPPIASYANLYIILTAELADDISLRHTVLKSSILHHVD